jgi:transcriptional regulator with XRE-family HTH domain
LRQRQEAALTPTELRTRRHILGLTQRELAVVLQVSANTVARWERGELRVGDPEHLICRLDRLQRRAAGSANADPHSKVATLGRLSEVAKTGATEGVQRARGVPSEPSSFVGREVELTRLGRLLKST